MDGQSPLSELCSVCYVEKPKYRCPGCKAQTCSLNCYKRHQQRASCSGKRDPGAYLKKNQLATPAGLDQDYNYLKGVERNINHAGQDSQDRGIGVRTAASKNVARGWRADSTLQRYLTENNITIEHAPIGMSRQKNNKTRPTKSNRIVWTVEWADAHGVRTIRHDCTENDAIGSLYAEHQNAIHGEARRPHGSKRKVEGERTPNMKPPKRANIEAGVDNAVGDISEGPTDSADKAGAGLYTGSAPIARTEEDGISSHGEVVHFYLLKPAASHSKVLIQLNSQTTLTNCLRDQIVQEYPTIIALDCPPQLLREGYILHEDYKKSGLDNATEMRQGRTTDDPTLVSRHSKVEVPPEELDPQSILEMLKRDVRT